MKNLLYGIGFTCTVVWCLWGCAKNENYAPVPEIRFKSMSFDAAGNKLGTIDTMAHFMFSFTDGDGDLGMDTAIMPGLSSKIHYTWLYKKTDGTYETYVFDSGSTEITANIPYEKIMNKNEAQNKTLKGTVEVMAERPARPYTPANVDTMRIEFFITDRADHKSNVEHTPDFSILNITGEVK